MILKSPPVGRGGCFAAAPAFAQNIAVVNGTPIPKSRADAMVAQLVQQGQTDSPQLQQAVRQELVNREILMQEAIREGIPNRPDVKAQVAVAQQTVVLRSMIESFLKKNQPTDAEVKARYDDLVKGAGGNREYHLHHILVSDEQQAKDLIAKIKAGAKFGISRSNTRRIRVRARTAAISTGPTRRRTCRNSQRPRRSCRKAR